MPQNLIEVWAVATRPNDASNGLGMSIEQASDALRRFKDLFTMLEATPEIYRILEALVAQHRVAGKATHDARLVAAMQVHGLTSILTFNAGDFVRYPGITVVRPSSVTVSRL